MLLAEASRLGTPDEDKSDVRAYTNKIVKRADEIAETIAYWIAAIGGGQDNKFPMALRRGLIDALERFDEYQLAKYDRSGRVTLKDAIRILHPKPKTHERADLYKRILEDNLAVPETWEVVISTKGSTKENWEAIAPKMGFMAILRNLRNFEKVGAEKALDLAVQLFTDAEAVRRSKQLPFRFYSAWKSVSSQRIKDALLTALDLSVANLESWPGDTVILVDNSGSMSQTPLSQHGDVYPIDIAAMLGAMATALCGGNYRVGVFGSEFRWATVSRRDSVITNAERIKGTEVGGATNAYLSIAAMVQEHVRADRIVLLSDMQCYDTDQYWGTRTLAEEWTKYRRQVNPKAILYSIDLQGYGTCQFPGDDSNVVKLAGWSERVLDLVRHYENRDSILDVIHAL